MRVPRPVALLLGGALAAAGASHLAAEKANPFVERLPDDAQIVASPGYWIFEQYCVSDDDHAAFTVFAAFLAGPEKFAKTYRFPISRQVYRVRVDTGGAAIHMPKPCSFSNSFHMDGDNPQNGTGINLGVSVTRASRRGVTLDVDLAWTPQVGAPGHVQTDLFFPWQTSARRRLAPDVVVSGWFEKPRPRPASAEPSPPAAHTLHQSAALQPRSAGLVPLLTSERPPIRSPR